MTLFSTAGLVFRETGGLTVASLRVAGEGVTEAGGVWVGSAVVSSGGSSMQDINML